MQEFENNAYFWQKVDASCLSGDFKTIYEKGSPHPNYPDLLFPANYGHILTDGDVDGSLKAFRGSKGSVVQAVVLCANLLEKGLSAIVLMGLTNEEELAVLEFLNSTDFQKSVIIRRGKNIPAWALVE